MPMLRDQLPLLGPDLTAYNKRLLPHGFCGAGMPDGMSRVVLGWVSPEAVVRVLADVQASAGGWHTGPASREAHSRGRRPQRLVTGPLLRTLERAQGTADVFLQHESPKTEENAKLEHPL